MHSLLMLIVSTAHAAFQARTKIMPSRTTWKTAIASIGQYPNQAATDASKSVKALSVPIRVKRPLIPREK